MAGEAKIPGHDTEIKINDISSSVAVGEPEVSKEISRFGLFSHDGLLKKKKNIIEFSCLINKVFMNLPKKNCAQQFTITRLLLAKTIYTSVIISVVITV